ncbi:MAG: phosphonate ABC transporter ATP-binding protein, partial [Phycicoccus sp.]
MSEATVRITGVRKRYGGLDALAGVTTSIRPGERVAVLGPSGAGKSTLLGLLTGAVRPTTGTVEVLGADLASLSTRDLRRLRSRIGSVSQRLDLVEELRVVHNVDAGRLGRWSTPRALWALAVPRADATVCEALERVGLGWAPYERTARLSGGERQRVALARVLVQSPDLVVADEPVSSLDPGRAGDLLSLLGEV